MTRNTGLQSLARPQDTHFFWDFDTPHPMLALFHNYPFSQLLTPSQLYIANVFNWLRQDIGLPFLNFKSFPSKTFFRWQENYFCKSLLKNDKNLKSKMCFGLFGSKIAKIIFSSIFIIKSKNLIAFLKKDCFRLIIMFANCKQHLCV